MFGDIKLKVPEKVIPNVDSQKKTIPTLFTHLPFLLQSPPDDRVDGHLIERTFEDHDNDRACV